MFYSPHKSTVTPTTVISVKVFLTRMRPYYNAFLVDLEDASSDDQIVDDKCIQRVGGFGRFERASSTSGMTSVLSSTKQHTHSARNGHLSERMSSPSFQLHAGCCGVSFYFVILNAITEMFSRVLVVVVVRKSRSL